MKLSRVVGAAVSLAASRREQRRLDPRRLVPWPGEVSLAHLGVLFLDELPEFSAQTIEMLRQPLEDRIVKLTRASATYTGPAGFSLTNAPPGVLDLLSMCALGRGRRPPNEVRCLSCRARRTAR